MQAEFHLELAKAGLDCRGRAAAAISDLADGTFFGTVQAEDAKDCRRIDWSIGIEMIQQQERLMENWREGA